jgi:phage tail sheath protein FI
MLSHCTQLQDRFAVLDPVRGAPMFGANSVEDQRRTRVETVKGHAALYYPWLSVPGATGTLPVLVPPSGHVAGVIARTDGSQGVHKAPAGMEALLEEVIGVERTMSDADQGVLNLAGVNVIRVFAPGGRPRVWGARTTASEPDWRYVNVRRLFLYLEESIEEGIRWAVFQPNGPDLWQQLRRTIGDFLTRVWRDGALVGERPEDASRSVATRG